MIHAKADHPVVDDFYLAELPLPRVRLGAVLAVLAAPIKQV